MSESKGNETGRSQLIRVLCVHSLAPISADALVWLVVPGTLSAGSSRSIGNVARDDSQRPQKARIKNTVRIAAV
jgi:hypothetical protein